MTNAIVYMSASVLPSTAANSVHVMKMSSAFARVGLNVTLIGLHENLNDFSSSELRQAYGVSDNFRIQLLPRKSLLNFKLRYALGILMGGWVPPSTTIYTRVPKIAALAARLGRKCVLELHYPPSFVNQVFVRYHLNAPSGGMIVVITETLKQRLVHMLGIEADKVIVAPDGADTFPYNIQPALAHSERCRVGYLGHLYPGKGMEVIKELAPRFPQADFIIVGGTEEDLQRWKTETYDLENIRFIGRVDHAETLAWLRSFDIALLPNQRRVSASGGGGDIGRWTSPLKAFEYMAAGLPIIASDLENLREILIDGETAFLCPPTDVEIWDSALRRLITDPELRQQIGDKAKRVFEENYTWERRARMIMSHTGIETS